ncbi:MAG: lipocalin family protein [Pseudomonadales bacterium]
MRPVASALLILIAAGCQTTGREPLLLTEQVDIPRFMGDWYVIAAIPTPFETQAWDAVERYRLDPAGFVETTFSYRKGGFDGPAKALHARGYVEKGSNGAVWGMQFVWPFRADYRVMYLDEDYQVTIIGRSRRDYLWIMAREPALPEDQFESLLALCRDQGYDLSGLRLVPQSAAAGAAPAQP